MIEGRYSFGDENIEDTKQIRKLVFIEEQGMPEYYIYDEKDKDSVIATAYVGYEAVATGRLLYDDIDNFIGRIAVKREHRGNNYGEFIVRMLIDKCINFGGKEVTVIAQESATKFYSKMGFVECGEAYVESGTTRVPMKLQVNSLVKSCSKM